MDTPKIITESRKLLREHYVFPDVAAELADDLGRGLAEGRYPGVDEPTRLAELVTTDLQSRNGDKHLRLLFHEEELAELPSREQAFARFRRDAARDLNGLRRIERLDGNIALVEVELFYPTEIAGDAIAAAMTVVADAAALIVDLRHCRGGAPETVALTCGYLFGDEPVHLNDMYQREGDRISQSWTPAYLPGRRFGPDKPVCVLISADTFSAGEELAYDLQQLGRATLVGETSRGGANPRRGFWVHPHLELSVPTGRAINPISGTNWEGVGVVPDVAVAADRALAAARDHLAGLGVADAG